MAGQEKKEQSRDFTTAFRKAMLGQEGEERAEAEAQAEETAGEIPEMDGEPGKAPASGENVEEAVESSDEQAGEQEDGETDWKELYEQEVQRFRSLEGRYRKERSQWREKYRELLGMIRGEGTREYAQGRDADADPAGSVDSAEAGPVAGDKDLEALRKLVREEAARLVDPLVRSLDEEIHFQTIAAAHPDWRDIAQGGGLEEWIEIQPGYMARTMRQVLQSGTAEQVVDLLNHFKADRERQSRDLADKRRAAETEERARQASAVRSRQAGPPKSRPDKTDFHGAWKEAARTKG